MEKIASFTVNHLTLEPGVYVSRVDADPATGAVVTTFDLRLTAPNREPVMDTAAVHAIEQSRVARPRGLLWPDGLPHGLLPHPLW